VWKPRARVAPPELTLSERKMNFSRFAVVFTHTVSAFARLGGSTVYQKRATLPSASNPAQLTS